MLTHISQEVLDQIVSELSKKFGKEDPQSIHTGDNHDYLGMSIDFSKKGEVVFRMTDCIRNMLDELPDDFDGTAATLATSYLFKSLLLSSARVYRSCCILMLPSYFIWPSELALILYSQ
jgi:hypothetical protein